MHIKCINSNNYLKFTKGRCYEVVGETSGAIMIHNDDSSCSVVSPDNISDYFSETPSSVVAKVIKMYKQWHA